MYDIIPLILILVSFLIIIIVVGKKFPLLANLDIANIPAEKEARFKERIISNRLKRNFIRWGAKITRFLAPAGEAIKVFSKWLFNKLIELKENYKREIITTGMQNISLTTQQLFKEAEELREKGEMELAEKKLIEIISLDSKNIKAFKALGKVYFDQKNYEQAKETFAYVLKFKENIDDIEDNILYSQIYLDLTLVQMAAGNLEEAFINIGKALILEPNNPRYLDTLLEISIIKKDKISALDAYERMKQANPENQKLAELKKQIDEI